MGNCLITKLNSKVDNQDLPKFNEIILNYHQTSYMPSGTTDCWVRFDPIGDVEVTAVGAKFNTEKGLVTTTTIPSGSKIIYYYLPDAANSDFYFIIKGKYYLTTVKSSHYGAIAGDLKISDFKYIPIGEDFVNGMSYTLNFDSDEETNKKYAQKLTTINLKNRIYPFNLAWLEGSKKITRCAFNLTSNNVVGDIMSLANCTNITQLEIYNSAITGDILEFVNAQRTNGRTECDGIHMNNFQGRNGANVTFNGNPYFANGVLGNGVGTLQWNAGHIMYINSATSKDPLDSSVTHVVCNGYTDEEIQVWENAGKTVLTF